jgi:hypothetical protein
MSGLRSRLADLGSRAAELRASLGALEKTPRAAALQQKLMERLGETTKESEKLSLTLGDQGAALSEARARVADEVRDLFLEEEKEAAKP